MADWEILMVNSKLGENWNALRQLVRAKCPSFKGKGNKSNYKLNLMGGVS